MNTFQNYNPTKRCNRSQETVLSQSDRLEALSQQFNAMSPEEQRAVEETFEYIAYLHEEDADIYANKDEAFQREYEHVQILLALSWYRNHSPEERKHIDTAVKYIRQLQALD